MIKVLRRHHQLVAMAVIVFVWLGIIVFHPPRVSSDTLTYVEAIKVLSINAVSEDFLPNRILTSYGYLQLIRLLDLFTEGDFKNGWLLLNTLFFLIANLFFYKTIIELYESKKIALFGILLIATNYAMVANALDYVMDIGGWASLSIAAYTAVRYMRTGLLRYVYYGAGSVAVGLFLKEYAILGLLLLILVVAVKQHQNIGRMLTTLTRVAGIALIPVGVLYLWIYTEYQYSYLDWLSFNATAVKPYYASKALEYVKALGSLFTFGWFLFVASLIVLIRNRGGYLRRDTLVFLCLFGVSVLPVLLWPFVTQRILFPLVPLLVFVGVGIFVRYRALLYWTSPVLALYIITNYAMDAYVLKHVNIDFLFRFLM